MKFFVFFILLLVCAALGYFLYPNIIIDPNAESGKSSVHSVTVTGVGSGDMKIEIDAQKIKSEELPEEVSLKVPVKFSSGDTVVELAKGAAVKLDAYVYPNCSLKDLSGKLTATTNYKETTLIRQAALHRVKAIHGISDPQPTKPTKKALELTPIPEPKKEKPEEEPKVKEEPKEEAPPKVGNLGDEELVQIAQESVKAGTVAEINYDAVSDWKASEKESLDGQEYQTVLATYDKETIFGNKPVVAKALIAGDKVQKWVYAQTGVEIQ